MKQSLNFDKIEKQRQDLELIENSLFKSYNTDKKEVITDKNKLAFKIVDNCKVSPSKAREYLSILASRDIITLDKELVYYKPSDKKLAELKNLQEQLDLLMPTKV